MCPDHSRWRYSRSVKGLSEVLSLLDILIEFIMIKIPNRINRFTLIQVALVSAKDPRESMVP